MVTDKTGNVAKKVEGTSLDEKVRILEAELKAKDAELTEKNNTIKCLQDFKAGVGLGSSAVGERALATNVSFQGASKSLGYHTYLLNIR